MCGRFTLVVDARQVEKDFNVKFELEQLKMFRKNYNTAPTHFVCVINSPEDKREAHYMKWGLIPSWVKNLEDFKATTFNARGETILEKPTYSRPFKKGQRCLVIANGYFEWKKEGKKKQAYYFTPKDGSTMAFAGLYETVKIDTGATESIIETCTIITCEPNQVTKAYHDRMPVILEPKDYDRWISPDMPERKLLSLFKACDEDYLDIYPVDNRVGKVSENDEHLIDKMPEQLEF